MYPYFFIGTIIIWQYKSIPRTVSTGEHEKLGTFKMRRYRVILLIRRSPAVPDCVSNSWRNAKRNIGTKNTVEKSAIGRRNELLERITIWEDLVQGIKAAKIALPYESSRSFNVSISYVCWFYGSKSEYSTYPSCALA